MYEHFLDWIRRKVYSEVEDCLVVGPKAPPPKPRYEMIMEEIKYVECEPYKLRFIKSRLTDHGTAFLLVPITTLSYLDKREFRECLYQEFHLVFVATVSGKVLLKGPPRLSPVALLKLTLDSGPTKFGRIGDMEALIALLKGEDHNPVAVPSSESLLPSFYEQPAAGVVEGPRKRKARRKAGKNTAENPVEDAVKNSAEEPVEDSVEDAVKNSVEEPVEDSVEDAVKNSVEEPVENPEKDS